MSEGPLRDWWEELLQVHEFSHYSDYAEDLTRRETDFLIQALSMRGSETILDLACGNGRHSLALAERGFTVVGLDIVAPVLAHARARATERKLSVEFVQGDMRELSYAGRFDVVLIMNSSLGFFDDATNRQVLTGAAQALAPGGRLLIQCINPYQIEAYLREFRHGWYAIGSGYVLRDAGFDPRTASLKIAYRYVDVAQGVDTQHPGDSIRLYGFPEIAARLDAAGLRPHSVFGDAILPPVPFGEQSLWQVIVAVRDQPESVLD